MKLRSLFLTILALFAMVLGGAAAQDMPMMDSCFELSAEDCAVINEASANNIGDATSFTIEIDIAFVASGIPDMDSLDFNMNGAIDVVPGMGMMLPVNAGGAFEVSSMMLGPDAMALEFAVVDDFAYFLDPTMGEWMGIDVVALMSSPEFSEAMAGVMAGDVSALGMGEMPDIEAFLPLLGVLELPGLMSYERQGDDFVFTIDFAALQGLTDPENAELVAAIDAAIAEVNPEMQGMAMMLPMVLSDGQIQIIQHVNTDLNIVDNIQFNANVTVAMGEEPITADLAVDVTLTNLDSAPAPEAPAEFTDMTSEVEGMSAGMGG